MARACQYGTELIGAEEADRLLLRAEIILIAGRYLLHPGFSIGCAGFLLPGLSGIRVQGVSLSEDRQIGPQGR